MMENSAGLVLRSSKGYRLVYWFGLFELQR